MHFLVTGTAGFIGFHLARRLLDEGHTVTGIDGFTPYYDVTLKERRNSILEGRNGFKLHRQMLEDARALGVLWQDAAFDVVIHLAAQAGVRYSIEAPRSYIDANIIGTFNILEMVRAHPVRHLMLASTSSVYGANVSIPFRESDRAHHPMSVYAATKMSTELIAHSYSHLFGIPTTAFRFFTVYGPWGRPDMALFKFTRAIIEGTPIDVYNHGRMERDFTYIDDLVEAVWRLVDCIPTAGSDSDVPDPTLSPVAPFRAINIGGGQPVGLIEFIEAVEAAVGQTSIRNLVDIQPGDVERTFACADALERLTGYRPSTPVAVGVQAFVAWYRAYLKTL
ncbi:MAG: NAD-dependent epimerase/dehydratase family protein [Hyphomicrobiaceae bacterium]